MCAARKRKGQDGREQTLRGHDGGSPRPRLDSPDAQPPREVVAKGGGRPSTTRLSEETKSCEVCQFLCVYSSPALRAAWCPRQCRPCRRRRRQSSSSGGCGCASSITLSRRPDLVAALVSAEHSPPQAHRHAACWLSGLRAKVESTTSDWSVSCARSHTQQKRQRQMPPEDRHRRSPHLLTAHITRGGREVCPSVRGDAPCPRPCAYTAAAQ